MHAGERDVAPQGSMLVFRDYHHDDGLVGSIEASRILRGGDLLMAINGTAYQRIALHCALCALCVLLAIAVQAAPCIHSSAQRTHGLIACAACIRFHVRCKHTLTVAIQIPDGDVRAAVATCVSCAWIKGACSTQAVGCRNSINYHGKAHVYIAHLARAPCGTT